MTALTAPQIDHACPTEQANAWITDHYAELRSRVAACFSCGDPERREEAVSEVLAIVTASVHRAAHAGALDNLTPYWSVVYAVRQFAGGRRAAGCSSTDALSEAGRARHGLVIHSLDRDIADDGGRVWRLRDVLADRDAEPAGEAARRNHDYPTMLASASGKAMAVFAFLAETHGGGKQVDLARMLMISPARITQLKGELAEALAAHGYHGPLGRRPVAH